MADETDEEQKFHAWWRENKHRLDAPAFSEREWVVARVGGKFVWLERARRESEELGRMRKALRRAKQLGPYTPTMVFEEVHAIIDAALAAQPLTDHGSILKGKEGTSM